MTNFEYKAIDKQGIATSGHYEAEGPKDVIAYLEQLGLTPIHVKDSARSLSAYFGFLARFEKVSLEDLVVLTRQLASLLKSGVPLVESLSAVHQQINSKKLSQVLGEVGKEIESGASFSDALAKHLEVFSPLIISMVMAGEKSGQLPEVLDRLSTLLDHELNTAKKIKAAVRYPLYVSIALAIAFVIIITLVIPRFVGVYKSFSLELPLPTKLLILANDLIVKLWYVFLAAMVGLNYLFRRWVNSDKGRLKFDALVLSLPVFGPLFIKVLLSRFARIMSHMLNSGITVTEALNICARVVDNRAMIGVINKINDGVSAGKNLHIQMSESAYFPPVVTQMVAVGERAGSLPEMLKDISDYFDREVNYTIDNLNSLIEPFLLLFLGGIILMIALGVFLPMWDLARTYAH